MDIKEINRVDLIISLLQLAIREDIPVKIADNITMVAINLLIDIKN